MGCSLPDEIISEILSPALKISEETFSDTSRVVSPFASFSQSTAALLLVCKAWLRVATPLLYSVVVIRSKAQAVALEEVLISNPPFGAFIKKLRVEGGYGSSMKIILKASPNITDILLSLAVWSSDTVAGLCKGLDSIDPIRVILYDAEEPRNNQQNLRLAERVAECMQTWKRLTVVDLPYYDIWPDTGFSRCSIVCKALETAPNLKEVVIPYPIVVAMPGLMMSVQLPSFLTQVRKNPSLRQVKIKEPLPRDVATAMERQFTDMDPTLKEFIHFTLKSGLPAEAAPASNPLFVPLQSAPQSVQDDIWGQILYFTMRHQWLDKYLACEVHTPSRRFEDTDDEWDTASEGFDETYYTAIRLPLVSKQFKRLAIPYLYRHISLINPGDLARFSTTLGNNPSLAKHVKTFCLTKEAARPEIDWSSYSASPFDFTHWAPDGPVLRAVEDALQVLFPQLEGLVVLAGGEHDMDSYPPFSHKEEVMLTISWKLFQMLGMLAGGTLKGFYNLAVSAPNDIQPLLVWEPFHALRALEWNSPVRFSLDADDARSLGMLPNLECLSLVAYDPSFLDVLAAAELPSIRRMFFHTGISASARGFFEKHSSKLTEVMFHADDDGTVNLLDSCPELPLLTCLDPDWNGLEISLFTPSKPHLRLGKLLVTGFTVMLHKEAKRLCKFLDAIDVALLPSLREIQLLAFNWPTNERAIAKNLVIHAAERLLEKNIKISDRNGKHWTPRLKTRKR
ncbi:hypothetical protein GGX14DRAFT_664371 [Mycena pura]|uniref:Uncharacterized protein n=1 Tax=Mycena pura TaxID=153505 RepID=A0AAD7E0G9_9AGAR|nr:hypothetical protein GGX14DRAFT_664371 [Mycena pura]